MCIINVKEFKINFLRFQIPGRDLRLLYFLQWFSYSPTYLLYLQLSTPTASIPLVFLLLLLVYLQFSYSYSQYTYSSLLLILLLVYLQFSYSYSWYTSSSLLLLLLLVYLQFSSTYCYYTYSSPTPSLPLVLLLLLLDYLQFSYSYSQITSSTLLLLLDLLNNEKPDERQIMTYVSCYYHAFQGAMQVDTPPLHAGKKTFHDDGYLTPQPRHPFCVCCQFLHANLQFLISDLFS